MKWLTPFILFTIVFAVGFGLMHSLGFDAWAVPVKALGTLALMGISLLAMLALAEVIAQADEQDDERQQSLIRNILKACSLSSAVQSQNLGAWALVLDRMRGQKPVLRWSWLLDYQFTPNGSPLGYPKGQLVGGYMGMQDGRTGAYDAAWLQEMWLTSRNDYSGQSVAYNYPDIADPETARQIAEANSHAINVAMYRYHPMPHTGAHSPKGTHPTPEEGKP